jgi:predicted metalloprotease
MQWRGRRESSNVDDRRGLGGGKILGGGIGALIVGVIVYLLGGDPSVIMDQQQAQSQPQTAEQKAAEDTLAQFSKVVMAETEDVWHQLFQQMGSTYEEPTLVLFSGYVETACGNASSAVGPFYCPLDKKVFIDLSFCNELKERFQAPGDFAIAYVIAHEVGHHVQNLMGISEKVQQAKGRLSETEANKLSVKLELQADFFAGVWAHHAQKMQNILDPGDIEEALNAASAVGDDKIQEQTQGRIVPDAFTHGTAQQRMYWFKKGFQTGDVNQGDTFNDANLASAN